MATGVIGVLGKNKSYRDGRADTNNSSHTAIKRFSHEKWNKKVLHSAGFALLVSGCD
jgi:hypothetical protein